MNRIQIVGKFIKAKHKISLSKSDTAELLFSPSSQEIKDLADGQWVQVIGDIWSHPERDGSNVIRAAIVNTFPGDKEPWSCGRITLHNPQWNHQTSFSSQSYLHGTTDGKDQVCVLMPILESRWAKKVGGLILPKGTVELEIAVCGASRLVCTSVISDDTTASSSSQNQSKLPSCDALNWHDKQDRRVKRTGRRSSISPKLRRQVFLRDGFKCQECGAMPSQNRHVFLEVDHIIPDCKGGSNDLSNLQTLCDVCNSGKGTDPAYQPTQVSA